MKTILLFCTALLCASQAMSVNWQKLDKNEQFSSYFDEDSVSVLPNPENVPAQKLSYTIKTDYTTAKSTKKKVADYTIEKYAGDCLTQKTMLTDLIFYINKGEKIGTVNLDQEDWQAVQADSLGEKQLKKACKIAFEIPYQKNK